LDLISKLGADIYRFSISWARVDPKGDGNFNEKGLEYYDKIINGCLKRNITPFITLHHWELPLALENQGGWLMDDISDRFEKYCEKIVSRYKGLVKDYITFNEPQCIIRLGYQNGLHAPGKKYSNDKLIKIWKNILIANSKAFKAIKEVDNSTSVGIVSTGALCYPSTNSKDDFEASRELSFSIPYDFWTFKHSTILDPICFGEIKASMDDKTKELFTAISPEEWQQIKCPPDFIGVNVYNGHEVASSLDGPVYIPRYNGFPRTALKWPVTPRVLNEGIIHMYNRYRLPIYITENGLSCNDIIFLDGAVHDPDRIDFLIRYLEELSNAVQVADIRGYFHWALTDNFEWHSGYTERFGLIFIDYPTGKRIPKDSFYWYRDTINDNKSSFF